MDTIHPSVHLLGWDVEVVFTPPKTAKIKNKTFFWGRVRKEKDWQKRKKSKKIISLWKSLMKVSFALIPSPYIELVQDLALLSLEVSCLKCIEKWVSAKDILHFLKMLLQSISSISIKPSKFFRKCSLIDEVCVSSLKIHTLLQYTTSCLKV